RSISFARNYMPLMDIDSEFASKWQNVCNIQNEEGLRDPIKVYEYLNWFYIVEGNKRVSVLKYLDIYSFHGTVTRLIPKYDENNKDIRLYYEFMEFNKKTGINDIWMSKEKSFQELWELIKDYKPQSKLVGESERFRYFASGIYNMFRKAFYELGGDKLPITTGDAFLDFLKIYGVSDEVLEEEMEVKIRRLLSEFQYHAGNEVVDVQQTPNLKVEMSLIGRLTHWGKTEKIKVGFAHAADNKNSSWTYSHELGRMHLQYALRESVETVSVFNLPESIEAAPMLQELVDDGCHIIFTTTSPLINATLKVAMDNPEVNFLNCSCMHSFKHVNTYFGRIHEPRFLGGIVAGAISKTGKLGYIAPFPLADILSGLNAFTLGARMVNPRVEVHVKWMLTFNARSMTQSLSKELEAEGVDIIAHHNTLANRQFSREYGIYTLDHNEAGQVVPGKYLAVPVWNWGIFYEKYLRSIIAGGTRIGADTVTASRVKNYWWGMDSGLLDFFYAKNHVPVETRKLLEFFKAGLMSQSYKVFQGPIIDRDGNLIVDEGEELQREQILSMDWLVDGIIGDLPNMDDYRSIQDLSTGKIV
ncbi:MAG: BMP family ABC transporter substrate-binding protein, partial [Clostridia bacterium]|nr:BMP family ABC transporter substrate-binding protein [Clostridia bacterium]